MFIVLYTHTLLSFNYSAAEEGRCRTGFCDRDAIHYEGHAVIVHTSIANCNATKTMNVHCILVAEHSNTHMLVKEQGRALSL